MNRTIGNFFGLATRLLKIDRQLDDLKICQAATLAELNAAKRSTDLREYEFKVFSQWGEDGILQHLTRAIAIENRTFVEFGVEDFFESNCRLLLMKDGWRGFVMDGSERNIERLRSSYFCWRYPLESRCAFVTAENVVDLVAASGFDRRLGILSIDVDGVDWYLLEKLEAWRAAIIVVEYNGLFGMHRAVSVPYDAAFTRSKAHWSNLYYGASLPAFAALLEQRDYALVGVNSAGSNAFFVRRDLLNDRVLERAVAECFRETAFREGRDRSGRLLMRAAKECGELIADLPLVDVRTRAQLKVRDVL